MKRIALGGLALLGVAACASGDEAQVRAADTPPPAGGICADIAKLSLPDTTVTAAELVPAGSPASAQSAAGPSTQSAAALPEHCRVTATIRPTADSQIKFELWMPARGWNGKFMGTGNGGALGAILRGSLSEPLARGYAVANTDTGHESGPGDFSWAAGHPEKLVDNAWRGVHLMTVQSKAIAAAYYGAKPKLSYWYGCSTGGRQGLKEVQRFPEDYDGVIAGAPAANWDALNTHSVMGQLAMTQPPDALTAPKLRVLQEAAIKACDAADGVADRVITNPAVCRFDPSVTQCAGADASTCLTAGQVAAARRMYAGVVDPATGKSVYPGTPPASETSWAAFGSGFSIGESYYRHVVKRDPNWKAADFRYADLIEAQKLDAGMMTAMAPDIRSFTRRGGKLILWHGWADGVITPFNTVNYYGSVAASLGSPAGQSVRLFMAPGVGHCSGGEGPGTVDWIAALEQWVEHGKAPETMIASKALPGGASRTRPLCAHPKVAKYSGSGSTDDAANFACVAL